MWHDTLQYRTEQNRTEHCNINTHVLKEYEFYFIWKKIFVQLLFETRIIWVQIQHAQTILNCINIIQWLNFKVKWRSRSWWIPLLYMYILPLTGKLCKRLHIIWELYLESISNFSYTTWDFQCLSCAFYYTSKFYPVSFFLQI